MQPRTPNNLTPTTHLLIPPPPKKKRRHTTYTHTYPEEAVVHAVRLGRVEEGLQAPLARADHPEHGLVLVAHEAPVGEADVGADGLDGLGERLRLLEHHLRARGHLGGFAVCWLYDAPRCKNVHTT